MAYARRLAVMSFVALKFSCCAPDGMLHQVQAGLPARLGQVIARQSCQQLSVT